MHERHVEPRLRLHCPVSENCVSSRQKHQPSRSLGMMLQGPCFCVASASCCLPVPLTDFGTPKGMEPTTLHTELIILLLRSSPSVVITCSAINCYDHIVHSEGAPAPLLPRHARDTDACRKGSMQQGATAQCEDKQACST